MQSALLSLSGGQLALLFAPALINLWGIVHAFRHTFSSPAERLLWMALCVFIPLLGGVAYLVFGLRRAGERLEP